MSTPSISNNGAGVAPEIGQYWPGQGGIYAGIIPGYEGGSPRHLIVSVDETDNVEWGALDPWELDARSPHNGATNTWALLVCGHEHPAARWAGDYTKDGHTDFHLPSRRELQAAATTISDKFEQAWYWSSTEHTWATAWGRSLADPDDDFMVASKDAPGHARAVRTFLVQE